MKLNRENQKQISEMEEMGYSREEIVKYLEEECDRKKKSVKNR